jgi:hypothetical protein
MGRTERVVAWRRLSAFDRGRIDAEGNASAMRCSAAYSRASDVGSIPIARSINFDDSIVLTPLNLPQ